MADKKNNKFDPKISSTSGKLSDSKIPPSPKIPPIPKRPSVGIPSTISNALKTKDVVITVPKISKTGELTYKCNSINILETPYVNKFGHLIKEEGIDCEILSPEILIHNLKTKTKIPIDEAEGNYETINCPSIAINGFIDAEDLCSLRKNI